MTGQLVQDDGAASAVLGVLLMAAITVTIASVALQINADLEEGPQPPAHVTLWTVPASPQARVMQADLGLEWGTDVVVRGSCSPLLNGSPFPAGPGTPVRAGDVLTCASGEGLVVGSSAERGNSLLYEASFR